MWTENYQETKITPSNVSVDVSYHETKYSDVSSLATEDGRNYFFWQDATKRHCFAIGAIS